MQAPPSILVLGASDVRRLLEPAVAMAAVEGAFRMLDERIAPAPVLAGYAAERGGYHWKAAWWPGPPARFAAKLNANFPDNPARHGLPTIQGHLVLCDGETGSLLALMDASELTALRTAAATALAASLLARPDASRLALVGCGAQAVPHVRALAAVRGLAEVRCVDRNPEAAARLAAWCQRELNVSAWPAELRLALDGADMVVTCTPSTEFIITRADIGFGTFVAGVGADAEHKRELAPDLLGAATVVVDVLDQAAHIGDLHWALEAGALRTEDVHAELGAVVTGRARGRGREEEIVVFDSTGMALQDAACAVELYERACAEGISSRLSLA